MMIQCVPDMEGSSSHHHDEALCVAEDFNVDFRLQQQHPKNNHHHHPNSSSRMLDLVAEQRSQQLAEIQVPHCQQQHHHHQQQQQQQPPQTQLMYHGYSPLTELIWKDGQLALNNLENRSMGAKNNNILAGCYSGPSNFFSSSSSLGSAEEDSCQWVSQDECGVLSAMDIDMVPPWVEDLGTHKSLERSAFGDNPSPHPNQNGNADSTAVAVASEGLDISKCSTKLSRFSGHHHHGRLAHEQGELPSESKAALQILASSDQADTALFSNSNSETDASKSKTNNSTSTTGLLPRTNSISWSDCRQRTSTATFSDNGDAMATTFPPSSSAVSPTASMSQMKQANDSSKCKRKSFNCQQDSPHQSDQEEEDKGSSQVSKSEAKRSSHAKRSRAAVVHNQSERRRRDRINERMKTLQKLLPHSSKTDKASMLDEAIEYLKHLQAQLQMMMFRNGMGMHPIMMPVSLPQLQMSMLASMGHVGLGMGMPGVMGIMNMNAVSAAAADPTGQDPGFPLNPQRHHPALVPPVPFLQPPAAAAAITPAVAAISSETAANPLQQQPVGLTMEAYHKLLLQQQQQLLQSQSGTMNKQNEQWHPQ